MLISKYGYEEIFDMSGDIFIRWQISCLVIFLYDGRFDIRCTFLYGGRFDDVPLLYDNIAFTFCRGCAATCIHILLATLHSQYSHYYDYP